MTIPTFIFNIIKSTSAIAIVTFASWAIDLQSAIAQPTLNKAPVDSNLLTSKKAFQPPSNPRPLRGYRTTTGTRQGSCIGDSDTAFVTLGPSQTMGLSASTSPSFVWHLPPSETSYSVQFRLLAPNEKDIPTPISVKSWNTRLGL